VSNLIPREYKGALLSNFKSAMMMSKIIKSRSLVNSISDDNKVEKLALNFEKNNQEEKYKKNEDER
jgi:hypothetical protein